MSKEAQLFSVALTALIIISFVLLAFISLSRTANSSGGNVLQTLETCSKQQAALFPTLHKTELIVDFHMVNF